MADGTIRYRMTNTAMPSGINAQAVYNGKTGLVNDRIWGGADNDTFWGGEGNDIIEGGDGADIALGGEGNDIITDLAGDDVPKGGPGNDAIDAGPGLDIIMAGDGDDFTNGGANSNEHFMGSGDDFAIGGQGIDAIFGDSGDDWEEGGDQPDLLIGDSSSFFFDDHNVPGHDILIGQGGDDDYDLEGGDDIGVAGPGVEKVAGAAGFDWEIGLNDPQPQDTDLAQVFVTGGVILPGVRDKFNEVEALSGGALNDTLRGDDIVPTDVGGGGFVGCDALDAAGVARINGLNQLITPAMLTVNPAAAGGIFANTSTHQCLLDGNVWGAGNILLGGAGSDLIEGRGADDIIDGDRYVNVRLSVRTNPAQPASQIGSTDLMTGLPKVGNFGTGTAGMTLQQAVFAGLVNPGNIVAVREILTAPADAAAVDTAVFSAARTSYTITPHADGSPTVDSNGGADGVDTVRNIEQLRFSDTTRSRCVAAPIASVTPATDLAFGNQNTGTTSTAQAITVSNTGTLPLVVSGVTVTGTDAASFTATPVAGCASMAPGASCTVNVTFAPTTAGAEGGHGQHQRQRPWQPAHRAPDRHRRRRRDRPGCTHQRPGSARQRLGERAVDGTVEQRRVAHHRVLGPGARRGRHPGRRAAPGRRDRQHPGGHRPDQRPGLPVLGQRDQRRRNRCRLGTVGRGHPRDRARCPDHRHANAGQRLGHRAVDRTGQQRRVGHHRVLGARDQRRRHPGRRAAPGRSRQRPAWSSPA